MSGVEESNAKEPNTEKKTEDSSPIRRQSVKNSAVAKPDYSKGKSVEDFTLKRKIGGGAEGLVYLAIRKEDQEQVAIKCIVCHQEKDIISTREEVRNH